MTIGYEKFVMDIDRCGMMQRMLAGLILNENELAKDAYREGRPGQTYLGTIHTQRKF
jgi:trimethylamine--corrinoid protein Co-methyltransferase